MDVKSGLTLYQAGGDEGVLCDPAPAADQVQNGERLSRGRAADLLGIRRDELDELAAAELIVVREDVDGKPYVTAAAFRKFLKNLEPISFIEAPEAAAEEDYDDEEEEAAPAPKAKAVTKPAPAAPAAEEQEVEEDVADLGAVTVTGPAAAVASFLRGLFGGAQAEEAEEAEEEAAAELVPAKQVKANPGLFSFGSKRKSGR